MGKVYDASHPMFEPCCLATTIGSLPHTDVALGTRLIFENTPQIPAWVQFPRRVFHENMMVQFTEGMPLGGGWLVADREKVELDRSAKRSVWLDVEQFQGWLSECGTHGHPTSEVCPACLTLLIEAVALYRADFLAGFTLPDCLEFDEWQFLN